MESQPLRSTSGWLVGVQVVLVYTRDSKQSDMYKDDGLIQNNLIRSAHQVTHTVHVGWPERFYLNNVHANYF